MKRFNRLDALVIVNVQNGLKVPKRHLRWHWNRLILLNSLNEALKLSLNNVNLG